MITGGNCESIVFGVEELMGPLTFSEHAERSHHKGHTAQTDHWRVRLALQVCENCPLSSYEQCRQLNPFTPGIRAGVYLSRYEASRGKARWQ